MTLNRVRVALTGAGGLPGVATFHFNSTVTDMSALRTFFDAVKAGFPSSVVIAVPNSGDAINENDGKITGAWAGPAQTTVVGTGAGAYLSTAGPMIRWTTDQVVGGRRPIGKTFLVPAVTTVFSSSGTIASATVTPYSAAAAALITAYGTGLKIYHRPKAGTGGIALTIVSGTCSNKQVVLRSRRD